MEYECIRLEYEPPLVYLVLARPDKINALSERAVMEIADALEQVKNNDTARAVIIRAEGKHFCAGHDLSEMTGRPLSEYRTLFDRCSRMMEKMHVLPQPIIAQVHGIATAAGCQLVASCDLVVAEEGASFGTPGVKIGLFCTTPMVPLTRAVGRKRAMEMLMTGRLVPAAEAASWGLVNKVVAPDRLADETRELAMSIIQASPLTIAIGKQAFYEQVDLTESNAYNYAKQVIALNLATEDAQEGITAFNAKRKPEWKGR